MQWHPFSVANYQNYITFNEETIFHIAAWQFWRVHSITVVRSRRIDLEDSTVVWCACASTIKATQRQVKATSLPSTSKPSRHKSKKKRVRREDLRVELASTTCSFRVELASTTSGFTSGSSQYRCSFEGSRRLWRIKKISNGQKRPQEQFFQQVQTTILGNYAAADRPRSSPDPLQLGNYAAADRPRTSADWRADNEVYIWLMLTKWFVNRVLFTIREVQLREAESSFESL